MYKRQLKKEVWEKSKYWALAEKGSLDTEHPGMKLLFKVAKEKKDILDLGCGEGTRLSLIGGGDKNLNGIDISEAAIKKAKRKLPKAKLLVGNVELLPYSSESFDLVYSAFVFEHLDEPEKVIREAVRVLKPGGNLLIMAPNYGAPNRASPPFAGSRFNKLFSGYFKDIFGYGKSYLLHWNKVTPIADKDTYEMDWDTTVEPYIGTLIPFLKNLGLKIISASTSWSEEDKNANLMQKKFRFLANIGIYPFNNWGPHLVILTEK